jgi:hypothetical protein
MTPNTTSPTGGANAFSPFEVPLPEIEGGVYRMFMKQETFTEEERAKWDTYRKACEEAEKHKDFMGLVDLGEIMEEGATDPNMLIEGLLVDGELHYIYGTKESGKTWVALQSAVLLINQGKTVIWADKEMGRKNMAGRLLTLGADPDKVSNTRPWT